MIVRLGSSPAPTPAPRARQRGMGSLFDDQATAVIVGARQGLPPGELYRRGMAGMDDLTDILDKVTGGKVTTFGDQLDRLEFWLEIAVVSSLFAGAAALLALRRK